MVSVSSLISILASASVAAAAANDSFIGNCTTHAKTRVYLDDVPYANATSTVEFQVQHVSASYGAQPWYYYTTLMQPNMSLPLTMQWLALPESAVENGTRSYTRLCTYFLADDGGTAAKGKGNETCRGILSDECAAAYSKPKNSMNGFNECPGNFDLKACKSNDHSMASDSLSRDVNCFSRRLPGIDLPTGYVAMALGGHGAPVEWKEGGEFAAYEKSLRRVDPVVAVFYQHEKSDSNSTSVTRLGSQHMCAAPSEVVPGSRSAGSRNGVMVWFLVVVTMMLL